MLKSSGSPYLIGGPKGIGVLFDAIHRGQHSPSRLSPCYRSSHAIERPTSSSLHFGRLASTRQQGGPQSAAPHSSAGAKRRTSARGGEWGEQTLQQACSQ